MKPDGSRAIEALRAKGVKPCHAYVHLDERYRAGMTGPTDVVIRPEQSVATADLRCLTGLSVTVTTPSPASETRLDRLLTSLVEIGVRRAEVCRLWLPVDQDPEDQPQMLQVEIIDGARI